MKNKRHCEITERDYKLLRFLWKWKAVSTMALAKKFFPNIDPHSAYRRLQFLEDDGYIGSFVVDGRYHEVWGLRDKGFKYILPRLGDVESKGYKSENGYHDFLASALHLGEWLTHQPDNTQTYSEQQLRRYPADLWPQWVPRSLLHRPDGYSAYTRDNKQIVVAFEAELSPKSEKRYESVVAFYDNQPSVHLVTWLVDSKNTFNALKRIFKKLQMRETSKHHFLLLPDFLLTSWRTPFIDGKFKGHSILSFLNQTGVEQASKWHQDLDAIALLDSRRRPINSVTSKKSKNP